MTKDIIVLKFGSSVLRERADLLNAVHEIYRWYRSGSHVVAVVSAIGRTTEDLLSVSRELSQNPEPWATAELLATGERASAALLGIALDRAGVPARVVNPREIELHVTGSALDGEPAAVNVGRIRDLFQTHSVLVVPGFFGTDASGRTQLLGRGGSDLTAVWLAVSLGARCRLLKDVDGVYESDPANAKTHPRRFLRLGYHDAMNVAGRLVQPKAIAHLQSKAADCEVSAPHLSQHTLIHGGDTELPTALGQAGDVHEPVDVLLLGCGTVGFGVYQRLLAFSRQLRICGVLVRDRSKYERAGVPPSLLHTRIDTIEALKPHLVVDTLPGLSPSRELLTRYLTQGANIVSANKVVMSECGRQFANLARLTGATLRHCAAAGGSAPMLEALRHDAVRGRIELIEAVLNGTCNFILDACARGETLIGAIAAAQRAGFAEADPSEDLSGRDAARKLRLLAQEAFGAELDETTVEGLDDAVVQAARVAAARGVRLRQVARAQRRRGGIVAAVRFEEVAEQSAFGTLREEWNALTLILDDGETVKVRGRGAGRWPTTEAVMADVFDALRQGIRRPTSANMALGLGYSP